MAGIGVFAVVLCTYAVTASPALGWLDSPEFVATSATLGVAHSPGQPLASMLGRLGILALPVGDVPFRVNLMSAVAAAAAAAFWAATIRALLGRLVPAAPRPMRLAAAMAGALLFAFAAATWQQATRAEVYAVQALLLAAALTAVVHYDLDGRARWLHVAALLAGLAVANHHFIAALFFFPAGILLLTRGRAHRPPLRHLATAASLALLGAASLLYLPVRAAQHPQLNWGAPATAPRFWWTLSAEAFQKSLDGRARAKPAHDALQLAAGLVEQVGVAAFCAALIALYLAVRQRRLRRWVFFLTALAAAASAGRLAVGYDSEVPDHGGYLLAAIAALISLGTIGFVALWQGATELVVPRRLPAEPRPARRGQLLGFAALLAAAVAAQVGAHARQCNAAQARASDVLARWQIADLPPRTVLLTAYFQTRFRLAALRAAEQSRPDIAVLDRGFLTYPGAAGEAVRELPDLADLVAAPVHIHAPFPVAALRRLAPRPVFLELHRDLLGPADTWVVPRGPFAEFVAADLPPSAAARAAAERADLAARSRLAAALEPVAAADRFGLRTALLWHDTNRWLFYCAAAARGAPPTAWRLPGDSPLEPPDGPLCPADPRARGSGPR